MEKFSLEQELQKIPDQMAFKIGDVAEMLGVKTYVLRYWEQEFKSLNPKKAANNQRIYSRRDVETVILIKKFLYDDQFSIPGARKALKEFRDQQNSLHAKSTVQPSSLKVEERFYNTEFMTKVSLKEGFHENLFVSSKIDSKEEESSKAIQEINLASEASLSARSAHDSAELLTQRYIKLEESIAQLISKIRSVKGKLEHRFYQIGL